jgi:hypothetical protein
MKKIMLGAVFLESIVIFASRLFCLNTMEMIVSAGTGLLLLPVVYRYGKRSKKNEEDYWDVVAYMEQFLCSYKRTSMIGAALQDCQSIYPDGSDMKKIVGQALSILQTGEGVRESIQGAALGKIQQNYPSRRMRMIHQYILRADQMGGDVSDAVDILLRNMQRWKERTALYQEKKKTLQRECYFSMLMSVGLCWLSCLLVPWNLRSILVHSAYYQVSSTAVIILFLFLIPVLSACLTGKWLDSAEPMTEKRKKQMEKNYASGKEKKGKLSFCFAKKVGQEEIRREFPYWIMSVTLFLQQDNVFQAVQTSKEYVSIFFRKEVEQFLVNLYENPSSLEPYRQFFEEYGLEEVKSGMKWLYSFQNNGYEQTSRQIYFLLQQNDLVMDQAERKRLEDKQAVLSFLRQIPMAAAGVKIVLDLLVFLMMTMGKYFAV